MKFLVALLVLTACLQLPAEAGTTAAAASTVTADFSADLGAGHAEVFGSGINVPYLQDPAKIDTLHQSGTRFIRGDAYLQQILPNTSIDAYLASLGQPRSVSDPAYWNWSNYAWVDAHHQRGTKTILILSYSVDWLGYTPGDGNDYSPPRGTDGFRVYEDVITKIYQHFRGKVDLIEVWNEPDLDQFMNLTNSPYAKSQAGKMAAYTDIYQHAAHAIRAVDPVIPIGGPTTSNPYEGQAWLDKLLTEPRIKDDIDFLTYHHYNPYSGAPGEPRDELVTAYKQKAQSLGKRADFPVYVTEWNYDWHYGHVPMNGNDARSISYAALRLTKFFNQHANGTNFFADNDEPIDDNFFGIHRNGMLPPKARVYQLLSQDLGLGAGDSRVRRISPAPSALAEVGAATTATGDNVAWVVNDGTQPLDIDLNLTGLGAITSTTANLFEASPQQNPASPKSSIPLSVSGGAARVRFAVPAKSVSGVRLTPYKVSDGENLASSASVTASSTSTADPSLVPANVIDGVIGVHGAGEWASRQEKTPTLTLTWPTPQTVGRVIIFDRANPTDEVIAGRLEFSDGSAVDVPVLPNDGTGKAITFAPRTVTSVKLVVTNGVGLNVGLSEIQVHDGANIVREGTVTTSSQLDLYGQVKAIDGTPDEWQSWEATPWIRVDWVNSHTVDRVVLADRASALSNVNGGTLTFSDGTSVPVSGVPTDGTPAVVCFPAKVISWMKFTVSGSDGAQVGLRELRVLSAPKLASSSQAFESSRYQNDPAYGGPAATDGIVNQWYAGEWASSGETNPRLTLGWQQPQTIGQVVLYDRMNLTDQISGGTLTFSDGSTVNISSVDNTGTGRVISFPPRTTTSVVVGLVGSGLNVGLSEIQAFR